MAQARQRTKEASRPADIGDGPEGQKPGQLETGAPGGPTPGLPGSESALEREAWGSLGGGYGEQTTGIAGPRRGVKPPTLGGPYPGGGPRTVGRPDEQIREDVRELLAQHPPLAGEPIEVEVKDGEVHLTGLVDSDARRELAEMVAGTVNGVKKVRNALGLPADHREPSGSERLGTSGGGRTQPKVGRAGGPGG